MLPACFFLYFSLGHVVAPEYAYKFINCPPVVLHRPLLRNRLKVRLERSVEMHPVIAHVVGFWRQEDIQAKLD